MKSPGELNMNMVAKPIFVDWRNVFCSSRAAQAAGGRLRKGGRGHVPRLGVVCAEGGMDKPRPVQSSSRLLP